MNLDFAPDADVLTNPDNTVVKTRSFGRDPSWLQRCPWHTLRGFGNRGFMGRQNIFLDMEPQRGTAMKGLHMRIKHGKSLRRLS